MALHPPIAASSPLPLAGEGNERDAARGGRRRRRTRSLFRCRRGSTAVEFAILAPPFIMLMMSTFEVGWFYFTNSLVDAATINAGRMIRTGVAQEGGLDKEAFFDEICPKVNPIGDCGSRLTVEVQTFDTFAELAADVSEPLCRDDEPDEVNALAYEPGMDNQIVRIRLCFLYDTLNPAIGVNLADTEDGRRRLISTHIFRNEPFSRNN
jgi:hypothetical protein